MKSTFYLIILSYFLFLISCNSKPKESNSNEILYSMEGKSSDGLQRMRSSRTEESIVWNEKNYHYVISCEPNDSLPKIKDEAGDVFVDNIVTLSIKRNNNESFFDKVTDEGVNFAASVSYPRSDLFVPVIITISSNGKMTIRKEVSLEENISSNLME